MSILANMWTVVHALLTIIGAGCLICTATFFGITWHEGRNRRGTEIPKLAPMPLPYPEGDVEFRSALLAAQIAERVDRIRDAIAANEAGRIADEWAAICDAQDGAA